MAVYTQVTAAELDAFWAAYDLPALTGFTGISAGVENTNYRIETETTPYILTLYERRVKAADLPFFVGLMQHLGGRGLTCPQPVAARDGVALRTLAGRPALVTTFLRGHAVEQDITPQHCRELGLALARLHNAGRDFGLMRENNLSLSGWRDLAAACVSRADEVSPGLCGIIAAELEWLGAHWPQDLPRGIIHADLFPDNVFFTEGRLSGLLDFYFACTDFLAYDLAICLNAWCFRPDGVFDAACAAGLVRAYHEARPLSPAERAALPTLCRGAAMRFLLTRLYDALQARGRPLRDPLDYLRRLRFHQAVRDVSGYGLEPVA